MPYKKTDQWVGMAIRRAIKMAADEGLDRIAWVTGEQSADRYDLSKAVNEVTSRKNSDGSYELAVNYKEGQNKTHRVEESELENYVGKDLAERIVEDTNKGLKQGVNKQKYSGLDLKVGGEGMKSFYNKIVPKVAKQEAKRLDKNAKVEVVDFTPISDGTGSDLDFSPFDRTKQEAGKQLSIPITPKMVEAVEFGVTKFRKPKKRGKGKIQWTETQSWKDMGMKPSDAIISTRNEAVRQAFVDLIDGKKTLAEARAVRDKLTPVAPIQEFFAATSLKRINEGLTESKSLKINKEIELEDGTMVDVRLDIPAYKDHNTWIVTIHQYSKGVMGGKVLSYTNAVRLKAPKGGKITFATKPDFALSIATQGATKNTIARIQGEISHFRDKDGNIIEDVDERGLFAEEYFEKNIYENPEWVQIGMNPFKRSDFWDRNNPEKTVVAADEVFQIGGLVYAKNPVYSESQGYDVMFTGINYNKIPLTEAQEKEIAKNNPDLIERFNNSKNLKTSNKMYRGMSQDDMDSIRINFPEIYEKIRTKYGVFIANAPNQESQPLRDKEGTVIKFRKPRGPLAEALSRASDKVQRASKMTNTQRLKSVEKDLLDFRAQTKRILASHENLSDVSSRFINVLGSPGAAQLMFSEYYEKIYQDLTPTDREFLDVIIAARRIVSINQKRADDNRASVKKLKSDIPQSFFDKGNLGIDAWESVMDDVSSMLATKPFAIDEILDAANTSLESQDVLYTDKITSTQQRKLAKDLKTALKDVLKEENYTGRDAKGKPVGLASARSQMYEIEDQLGAKKFNKLTQRADEYFFAFMELLDDDLKAGLISKEQYDAMAGIEYSPRVFLTYLFNLNDELIKRDPYEVDFQLKTNYSLSGPVIRTLKNGIKDNKASENIFYEFVGDSQLVFSNYLATRQKLRMYNDLNQRTSEELSGLQKRQVELKNKSKLRSPSADVTILNTEEQNELDMINEVFDNFSLTQKRGFVPNRYMVDGKENFFYIREDINEQWNNIRPNFGNFASESSIGKVAMWALTAPVSALRTFATGTLAPLFGIGNAAVDSAHVLNFSLAEGYSEFMPARTVQFLKDLGIVPGMPMETATKSVRTQDALFREAVMEGVMMDYLHTRGREGEPVITQMLDWMAGQVDDVAIVDPAFRTSRKALRKMFDASLYINKQSELAPRMAIYKRVRDHYYAEIKKQNLTSKDQEKARKDARQKAAMYARELMNFAEGGRLTKAANPFMAYLNARFLGFTTPLYGALSSPKNFAKIFSRTMQFSTMSLSATFGLAYWLVSMFMDDEDEKEGKKPIDVIRETREQASPYIRQKYYLIPMGLKDEDGNYKSIRIKKNPSLVPALEMGEMYMDNLLEGKSAKDALPELNLQYAAKINHAVFDNLLPMNVSFWDEKGNTRGLEMASEVLNGNPGMSGIVEIVTGYDLYRNRPIKKKYFNEMNISEAYLGYADDRVQPFYKDMAMFMKEKGVMDVSPYNIQHFSQKMITTPENNPYVYTAYSMLNKASGTDAYEAKDKTFMENIMKGVSKKVIYSSRYRPGIENENFSELNDELQNNLDKDFLIKQELNKVADKAAKEGGFGLLLSKEENVEKVLKAKDEFFSKLEGYGFEVNDKDRDIYISELAEKVINNYAGVEESNNRKLKDIIYLGVGERKERNMALAFWMAYPQLDYDSKKPITEQAEEFLETISNLSETYAQVKGQKEPKLPDSFYLELISVYKEYEIGKDTKGK